MKKCFILCAFVPFIILVNCESENVTFYIVKQYDNEKKYYCITNSSYALSWITIHGSYTTSEQTSRFTLKTTYFQINKKIQKAFISKQSDEHILDRRWERMPMYTTSGKIKKNKEFEFTHVMLDLNGSAYFTIPFSVHIENEGHIYLCNGTNVSLSSCYWITMEGFAEMKITKIKKCEAGEIPLSESAEDTCEVSSDHSREDIVDLKKWNHLKIVKTKEYIALLDFNNRKIVSYNFDSDNDFIDVNAMIIRSKKNKGLWKIHTIIDAFDYENENLHNSNILLGQANTSICLSILIQRCEFCRIKCFIQDYTNNDKEEIEAEIRDIKSSSWKEIICKKEQLQRKVSVWLNINQTNNITISSIEECSPNVYRIIESEKPANCQLMSSSNQILSLDSDISDLDLNEKCNGYFFGKNCLSCSLFLGPKCGQLKYCEKIDTTITCTCSAGFKSDDKNECLHPCKHNSYGHFCKKSCHTNCAQCDSITGACNLCSQNYLLPNCTTRATTMQLFPSYTNVTVQLKTTGTRKNIEEILKFKYKEINNDDNNWIIFPRTYKTTKNINVFTIENLKPGTRYYGQYFNENNGYSSEPEEFTTVCDNVAANNFVLNVSNTSVTISLKQETLNRVCPFYLDKSSILLEPTVHQSIKHKNERTIVIGNLAAFQKYTLSITSSSQQFNTTVFTTEGVPEKVKSLKVTEKSENQIFLAWEQPTKIYGTLKHYNVLYGISRYFGCKENQISNRKLKTAKDEYFEFRDLLSYTEYTFEVKAVNNKFEGETSFIKYEIKNYKCLENKEIPEIENIDLKPSEAAVQLSLIKCTNLRGPITFSYQINCSFNKEEWCVNYTSNTEVFDNKHFLPLKKLKPFTNYLFIIKFYRPNTNCNPIVRRKSFKTLPDTPYAVNNLNVYAKNNHSISLRWTPPHPPTGRLKSYKIVCYNGLESKDSEQVVDATSCTCNLWQKFCCYTIRFLTANSKYGVDIRARNEDPSTDSPLKNVYENTIIEPSMKPTISKFIWTFENNLKLVWEHPTKANGDLTFFNISVIEDLQTDQKKKSKKFYLDIVGKYKKVYHYSIKWKELKPNTQYKIVVQAFNGLDGEGAEVETFSPPEIPLFESNINFKTQNFSKKITFPKIKNYFSNYTYDVYIFLKNDTKIKNCSSALKIESEIFEKKLTGNVLFYKCRINSNIKPLTIETNSPSEFCEKKCMFTEKIKHFIVVLVSSYNNISSHNLYDENSKIPETSHMSVTNESLLYLLILLLFPLSGVTYIAIRFFKNKHSVDSPIKNDQPSKKSLSLKNIQNAKSPSEKISVAKLEEYVKKSFENGELDRQHELFPRGQTKSWDCGALKENKSKNRYNNLMAYDHTRVILDENKNGKQSDYINANYIDGYKIPKAYVATQGPKASTLDDFWQMIWQENVHHIAMLANVYEGGKKKVEKYWPEQNETLHYASISVRFISSTIYANYELRIFQLENGGELRQVHQYHFNSWPDHGVPRHSQSLIPFLQKLQSIPLDSKSPVVVHCSAGVGRTGTIILCDISLRMAAKEGYVDFLETLGKLREQRANMVDNATQYKLAHLLVLEYLFGVNTSIACNEIGEKVDALLKSGGVRKQLQHLEDTAWQDQLMKMEANKATVVEEKNRFKDIVPETPNILLPRYPSTDEKSTYINAVLVDGFEQTNRFIVTQQPMPNTLGDFWRLIHENDISVIVSLNEVKLGNTASCRFWPSKKTLNPVDYITLKHVKNTTVETHDAVTVQLVTSENVFKQVEILAFKDWPANTPIPKKMAAFLSFLEDASNASRNSSVVVVTCFDGATASGLYVALSFVLEKMKLEQVCDVCQAVRSIRHNRSQFVKSEEQFEFLYKAAVEYIKEFQFYANFN